MRETLFGASALREEGFSVLRDPLSPAFWQSLFRMQSSDCR